MTQIDTKNIDFSTLPGIYTKHSWQSEDIFSYSSRGKKQVWRVVVGLINGDDDDAPSVELNKKYFESHGLPDGYCGTIHTEHGAVEGKKLQHSRKTIVSIGKNIGRKNQTNALTQAIKQAVSKYNVKVRSVVCKVKSSCEQKSPDDDAVSVVTLMDLDPKTVLFPPMLASSKHINPIYDDKTEDWILPEKDVKKLKLDFEGGLIVQPKLDGVRCIAYWDPDANPLDIDMYCDIDKKDIKKSEDEDTSDEISVVKHSIDTPTSIDKALLSGDVRLYSRGLKPYMIPYIIQELREVMRYHQDLYLDGELYVHGKPLQEISGIARRSLKHKLKKGSATYNLEYHIYGCFYKPNAEMDDYTLSNYDQILHNVVFPKKSRDKYKYIKIVESLFVRSPDTLLNLYKAFIDMKYEGAMIRIPHDIYRPTMTTKTRSHSLIKVKPRESKEFKVVAFADASKFTGKDKNANAWICETEKGDRFSVVPNRTLVERVALYKKYLSKPKKYKKKFLGRMYTVEYSILSKTGIPQQPRGVGFRDYE